MQIELTADQEAQLARVAAEENKSEHELARELLGRALTEEADFIAAVNAGIEAADRGDFVEPSEVWARIEKILQS